MRYAVGVDVGGTHLRVGLVDETGKIHKKIRREVGLAREVNAFFEQMAGLIQEVAGDRLDNCAGIGLGLPGICNQQAGVAYQLPHYPSWQNVPAVALLQKSFSVPIVLDNDANMAAIGEHWLGAAQDWSSFIMLTLGTGIGGGLFLNGKIWHGDEGFAGEVGHMTIETDGRPCACGNRGCWETYAASQAVPKGKTALDLARLADQGESEARKFWEEFGRYLGIGIANLAHITGIEKYVLGGSIAGAAQHFLESCLQTISNRTYRRLAQSVQVIPSLLGEDGNLLGAARAVL